MLVSVTQHAYDRAKERLRWRPEVLDKMAEKAFVDGVEHKDTKGSLNRYITKLWLEYRRANNIRIYGENIYLFCGNALVTVFQLPNNMRKRAKKSKHKQ